MDSSWIPVERSLPDDAVDVLVYGPMIGQRVWSYDAGVGWLDEKLIALTNYKVTHWQQLPADPV